MAAEVITAYTTITTININIIHANLFHTNKLLAIPAITPPGGTIIEDHRP